MLSKNIYQNKGKIKILLDIQKLGGGGDPLQKTQEHKK